ncbi:MAG TPA: hypothetical protein DDW65_24815 [Firmicutes bacterium]|nr:hypothetical protein [Bacillota bacterium]
MKPSTSKANKPASAKIKPSHDSKGFAGFCKKTFNLLFHEDIYFRICGFLIFGLLLFFASWAFFSFVYNKINLMENSFMVQKFFSPQIVKGIGPWAAKLFGSHNADVIKNFGIWGNVILLTVENFFNHLAFVIIFIFIFNYFRIGRWNMSLIYFALYTIMWGAAMGTLSLPFPTGSNRILGSLILFARYGLWIWFSYLLLIVSSTQFTWLAAPSWLDWNWQKQRKFWPVTFTPDQREVFIYGLLFLLASSFAEARIFVHYNFF